MIGQDSGGAPISPEIVDASTASIEAIPTTAEPDGPVRILVQTRTDLVPGDKSTKSFVRKDAMENLICQHVWQRNFDDYRERRWDYNREFAWDSVECWFLVDHHGPDDIPPPDPPVIWYRWTGKELLVCLELTCCLKSTHCNSVMVHDPLPRRVRRRVRSYPFTRIPPEHLLNRRTPRLIPPPRVFESRDEEIRVLKRMLRDTLACNSTLTEELVRFAKKNPGPAEWVRARVPPDAWARVDDESEIM